MKWIRTRLGPLALGLIFVACGSDSAAFGSLEIGTLTQYSEEVSVEIGLDGTDSAQLVVTHEGEGEVLFDEETRAGSVRVDLAERLAPGETIAAALYARGGGALLAEARAEVAELTGEVRFEQAVTYRDESISLVIGGEHASTFYLVVTNLTSESALFAGVFSPSEETIVIPASDLEVHDELEATLYLDESRQEVIDVDSVTVVYAPVGSGTEEDPFLLSDIHDMALLGAHLDAHFRAEADIDLTGTSWEPVGAEDAPFTGSLVGQNHRFTGLEVDAPGQNDVGLFGFLGEGAEVRSLRIEGASVAGAGNVGVLAGTSHGRVEAVVVDGTVEGTGHSVGGLVGNAFGDVVESHADVSVQGNQNVGGLVGALRAGAEPVILRSSARGSVHGVSRVGGLLGTTGLYSEAEIVESFAIGAVSCSCEISQSYAGGLAGSLLDATLRDSYALGAVEAPSGYFVGGLVGHLEISPTEGVFAAGKVEGGTLVGGLVGNVFTSASAGPVSRAYFDTEATEQSEAIANGSNSYTTTTALTTSEMQGESASENMSLDFDEIWITREGDYPDLVNNPR